MGKHNGKNHLPAAVAVVVVVVVVAPKRENTMEKITSRQQNTMPLKDGEAPKLHLENA